MYEAALLSFFPRLMFAQHERPTPEFTRPRHASDKPNETSKRA
jgi:hypothetical protein